MLGPAHSGFFYARLYLLGLSRLSWKREETDKEKSADRVNRMAFSPLFPFSLFGDENHFHHTLSRARERRFDAVLLTTYESSCSVKLE